MFTSEGRQGAEAPTILQNQRRKEIPSSGLEPTLAVAILPARVGTSRKSPEAQSDAVGDGQLVYAVYNAAEPQPMYLSGRASRDRKTDRRIIAETVSDEMLLKHVAEGDKAAMHIIFARHRAKVFRFIQRMVRNPTIADDIVSQVFLDVWRSANRFESRARVSTWLLSIARFRTMSFLRKRTHDGIDQGSVLEVADAGDTPEVTLDRKETNDLLRASMNRLSPPHREIIDLFYYREKSVVELSEIVGIPKATAKSRLFYARKQLARILVSAGFDAAAIRTSVDKKTKAKLSRGLHQDIRAGSSAIDGILRPAPLAAG
jgi:RNA polymerase sigma-70 factor (ECF subfamily)